MQGFLTITVREMHVLSIAIALYHCTSPSCCVLSVLTVVYEDYLSKGSPSDYVWPWNAEQISVTESDVGASEVEAERDLAAKIGIGIGASLLILLFLGGLIACCYVCCCKTNTKKVQPHGAPAITKTSASVNNAAAYPRQGYMKRPPQQRGVYMIPQPQGPANQSLPPLATGMPKYPTMPQPNGTASNYPPQTAPPPYPTQKYSQPPPYQTPSQPSTLPKQQHSPPKHSMSTIAFALRQPKPLKPISDPFGRTAPQHKTEEEMMALGRARLNWNIAIIPGPAAYVEPQQWRQRNRGAAPPIQPPPLPQSEQFAETDLSYNID